MHQFNLMAEVAVLKMFVKDFFDEVLLFLHFIFENIRSKMRMLPKSNDIILWYRILVKRGDQILELNI